MIFRWLQDTAKLRNIPIKTLAKEMQMEEAYAMFANTLDVKEA